MWLLWHMINQNIWVSSFFYDCYIYICLKEITIKRIISTLIKSFSNIEFKDPKVLVLVSFFVVISIFATPHQYAKKNEGRYLLRVVKNYDNNLFHNDLVVKSLGKFKSIYYDLIGYLFKLQNSANINTALRDIIFSAFVINKISFFLLLILLTRALNQSIVFFIIFAIFAMHSKSIINGSGGLFMPMARHSEIAILTGIASFISLLYNKNYFFWIFISITILTHSLIGIHLLLTLSTYIIINYDDHLKDGWSILIFIITIFYYNLSYAPTPMTIDEAKLFLNVKTISAHVSFFKQGILSWVSCFGIILLALLLNIVYQNHDSFKIFNISIISGSIIAFSLSTLFYLTNFHYLALIQPIRIFLWVSFFCFVSIINSITLLFYKNYHLCFILFSILCLIILNTLWFIPLVYIVISYLISKSFNIPGDNNFSEKLLNKTFVLFGAIMTIAIMVGDSSDRLSFLNDLEPLFIIIPFLLLIIMGKRLSYNYTLSILALVLTMSFALKTIERHDYFKIREDQGWDDIRRWFPKNTLKTAKVIVAGGSGNFRTLALRSCYGESESALSWVDPNLQSEISKNFELVNKGYINDSWDINYKMMLSKRWGANYILIKGNYHPDTIKPIYSIDDYHIFQNDNL